MEKENIQVFKNSMGNKYIFDPEGGSKNCFKVEQEESQKKELPIVLSKFYSIEKTHNIDALVGNYLYAAHTQQLNDPFDCYSHFFEAKPSLLYELVKVYAEESSGPLLIKSKLDSCRKKPEKLLDTLSYVINRSAGVISMTDSENNSTLQWDHYTNHKGFAVYFYTHKLMEVEHLQGPFPVSYEPVIKKISLKREKVQAQIFYRNLLKRIEWEHENEWRFFGRKPYMYDPMHDPKDKEDTRYIPYPIEAIERIVLGAKFIDPKNVIKKNKYEYLFNFEHEDKNRKRLLEHIQKKQIPLSVIVLDHNHFNFRPIPIDYEFRSETNTLWLRLLE
ncbi:MAG: DUF2971 domain-containing protein [Bacteroidales bacterium]|nr:DUF2971 domain-containing protein [Bacteroidales bacterium]